MYKNIFCLKKEKMSDDAFTLGQFLKSNTNYQSNVKMNKYEIPYNKYYLNYKEHFEIQNPNFKKI